MGERRRVLIFDDSPLALHMISDGLMEHGFEVRTAIDLVGFDRTLQSWQPHVILTDLDMPEISGGTLCAKLKANIVTARTPVVLFSAAPRDTLDEIARDAGADVAISKEDGVEHLGARLHELCEEILW